MFLVVCLALLAAVVAQEPHPCRSPEQFEGRRVLFDPDRRFFVEAQFAYDDRQRRFREMESMQIGREHDFYDTLYLYEEGKQYRVNLKTRHCNVTGIHRPWIPFSVPSEARFRGSADIGAAGVPDEHVLINIFDGHFDGNPYFMTTTATDCVAITTGFYSNRTGGVTNNFFDVSIGISDPMAFIPPRECE